MKSRPRSSSEYRRALRVLAGGVNSPVRSFKGVGGHPVFIRKGKGSQITDVDGRTYVDFCQSWGALILGHAHPGVVRSIARQAECGTSFGACTAGETNLAELLKRHYPSSPKWRFTSSGTEAVMTAIRLARGITARNKIIKFEGCYHGHGDSLLVKAGSGLATIGKPSSKGIPDSVAQDTLVLPYNCEKALQAAFKSQPSIACVIVEPIAGNMGLIPGNKRFLRSMKRLCRRHGALLIFDEVISGFRADLGGAQALMRINPDITTLGKVIGGGLPIGAVGASHKIMSALAPDGDVYQAGTLSGNPISVTAGFESLKVLTKGRFFQKICETTERFTEELRLAIASNGIPVSIPRVGSMFSVFFQENAPQDFRSITPRHCAIYKDFFHHMLDGGVYLPPSGFEALFVSASHRPMDLQKSIHLARSFRLPFLTHPNS